MKPVQVLIVNAFTHQGEGGNPAGVVLDADILSDKEKQAIARQIGLSETAFVSKSQSANYRVDFFTPTSRIAMCGHATIAAWSLMSRTLPAGQYTQELVNGVLGITLNGDGSVVMEQELPKFGKKLKTSELALLLGLKESDFLVAPKPQLVSTGVFDLMVGVKDVETLNRIIPNFDLIKQFQQANNEAGIHVFTLDPGNSVVARIRDFCPLLGIPEESATGGATGALLCYLHYYGLLTNDQVKSGVWFEQGYSMNKPSDIFGKLTINNENKIAKVEIGGKATLTGNKKISI